MFWVQSNADAIAFAFDQQMVFLQKFNVHRRNERLNGNCDCDKARRSIISETTVNNKVMIFSWGSPGLLTLKYMRLGATNRFSELKSEEIGGGKRPRGGPNKQLGALSVQNAIQSWGCRRMERHRNQI